MDTLQSHSKYRGGAISRSARTTRRYIVEQYRAAGGGFARSFARLQREYIEGAGGEAVGIFTAS